MALSVDSPEVQALAQMAAVDPANMAAAFNDPKQFFKHMTLEELNRLKESCGRFAVLQAQMVNAMDVYAAYGKGLLEGMSQKDPVPSSPET